MGLRQFLAIKSPLKRMRKAFFKIFFGYIEKRFHNKAMVYFKIHDITNWTINNSHKNAIQYLKK